MAFADPLGIALWRLKWAYDPGAYAESVTLLVQRSRKVGEHHDDITRLCQTVLLEWMDENCNTCGGRGHMVHAGTPHASHDCPTCGGTGMRRYSEAWRAHQMGVDGPTIRKWDRKFAAVHRILTSASKSASYDIEKQLEDETLAADYFTRSSDRLDPLVWLVVDRLEHVVAACFREWQAEHLCRLLAAPPTPDRLPLYALCYRRIEDRLGWYIVFAADSRFVAGVVTKADGERVRDQLNGG